MHKMPGFYWVRGQDQSCEWTVGEVQRDGWTIFVIGSEVDSTVVDWNFGARLQLPEGGIKE